MTVHCTACREQNGNKIYYTNLRKVWKERSVINLYWKILKSLIGNIFSRLLFWPRYLISELKSFERKDTGVVKFI